MRLIAVPFYDSLSIRRNWQDVKQLYPDITHYFPDYDPEYMPSRKFFWEIFASLHYEDAKTIIRNERKRKYEKEASEKTKEIIISKDVLNLIQGSLYYSKKKEELSTTSSQRIMETFPREREGYLNSKGTKEIVVRYQFLTRIENLKGPSVSMAVHKTLWWAIWATRWDISVFQSNLRRMIKHNEGR